MPRSSGTRVAGLLALATLGLAAAAASAQSTLLLRYSFDDPNNPLHDDSGNGYNGTLTDLGIGAGPTTDGRFGAGAYKIGAIDTPSITLPSDAFSIAMWVKIPAGPLPNSIQMLVGNSNGGYTTSGFRMYLNNWNTANGRVVVEAANGTTGSDMDWKSYPTATSYPNPADPSDPGTRLSDGGYHLIVWTMDLTNQMEYSYYDNKYLANTANFPPDFNRTGPLRLGATLDGAFADNFEVDEFRVYHGVLAGWEVVNLMNQQLAGDANMDGKITGDDYALIDKGFNTPGATGWQNGDFNGDGKIDSADYLLIDTSYGKQTGQLPESLLLQREAQFGPSYVSALEAAVPEPASLSLLALPLLTLASRRRR